MTWKRFSQQQQRGAQLHARPGDAPKEAVKDRDAQQHELADMQVAQTDEPQRGIDYPATNPPDRKGDITPSAPTEAEKQVDWDEVVQPEHHPQVAEEFDEDMPAPEGK